MNPKPLAGKTVVMTGTLSVARDEFAILIEDAGGLPCNSLSKSTDILVVGAEPGQAKLDKARTNGTAIWDEGKIRDVIEGKSKGLYTQKIYGCSDDLVELKGEVNEEFNCFDKPIYARFSTGTYVKVEYNKEGLWRIEVLNEGKSVKLRKLYGIPDSDDEGPAHQSHCDKDAPVYSDVLIIESETPITLENWGNKPLKEPSPGLAKANKIMAALDGYLSLDGVDQDTKTEILEEIAGIIDNK